MKQLLKQVLNWQKPLKRLLLLLVSTILATGLIATPAGATGVYQMPELSSIAHNWVVDKAEVLARPTEGTLNRKLENLAKQTGKELRVVTIRRLDYGETPEKFAKALFEKWFPTESAQANQTLLLIDTLSNGSALRTGNKSNTLLSSDIADSVINETLLAPLREGDKYNQAIQDASERLIAVLSGQPDPGPPQLAEVSTAGTFKSAEETKASNANIWVIGLLIAATVIPMATYYLYQIWQS